MTPLDDDYWDKTFAQADQMIADGKSARAVNAFIMKRDAMQDEAIWRARVKPLDTALKFLVFALCLKAIVAVVVAIASLS